MTPQISVIIPAWNAEPFIEKTLASIQNQNLKHFEAIIVDAESTDTTADIVREFCAKDPRFKLLYHKKCPPGIARNFGMANSLAPFISFCDADDVMDSRMLQTLLDRMVAANADIAVCDFDMVYPNRVIGSFSNLSDYETDITSGDLTEYYYKYCAAPKPNNYVWSRLYRRSFLDCTGITFGNSRYSEDLLFNIMLLCNNPKITHIGKPLYQYIQYEDSLVRRNVRETNHGLLYLSVFTQARKYLEDIAMSYTEPILAIYAYTRIKSILFYASQAKLDDSQTHKALESFVNNEAVRHYLGLCVHKDYIDRYRHIHGYSLEWAENIRDIINACINNETVGFNPNIMIQGLK